MEDVALHENLKALENLMTEFFRPDTSNQRKRSIEELLNNFSQQKDAWKHCLYFVRNSENEYVMMYGLSVVETIITKQWHGLPTDSKREIREILVNHLLQNHEKLHSFIVNKLAKLNVDIARHDWPHFYHDFLTDILQMIQLPNTAGLAMILIQTTSEEMATPKEDLSISRKQELQQLLLENMPSILISLTNVLDSVLEKHKLIRSSAHTPPPSPIRNDGDHHVSAAGLDGSGTFQSLFGSMSGEKLADFDKSSHQLCSQALSCIGHLFSWIPLSNMITSNLLTTIFNFASFGCESNADELRQSLGRSAMLCINELINKNCVPPDFESYLLQLFLQTFFLLKKLTGGNTALDGVDSTFLDKFTEFLRLFVNNHLKRFESNPQFPVLEFLSLLFEYTFKQCSADEFFACLEIWQVFLDYLKTKVLERTRKDLTVARYYDGILGLVKELLKRMQFKHNRGQLELLDHQDIDDDGLTELQTFISNCNDTLAAIAELIPDDIIKLIDELYFEQLESYKKMSDFLSSSESKSLESVRKMQSDLKDLCITLQMYARMVAFCSGATFADRFDHTEKVVKSVIQLADYNMKMKFYNLLQTPLLTKKLSAPLIEVYSQTLSTLKSYTPWMSQYYMETFHRTGAKEQCAELITVLVSCTTPSIDHQVPVSILEWSVNLLSAIFTVVRPVYLYDLPHIQEIYTKLSQGYAASLPPKQAAVLCNALSSYLILKWPALPDSEQKWELRSDNHYTFIHALYNQFLLVKDLDQLSSNSQTIIQAKPLVIQTVSSIIGLIESIGEEPKKTKEIMYRSISDYVQLTLQLFKLYMGDSDVTENVLQFFLCVIRYLRVQMGISFTEQTIQTFLNLLTKERLVEILAQENQTAYRIVESFLKMLQLIVQDTCAVFKSLLPHIIAICVEYIYPIVATKPTPDVKLPLYELLYEILNSNWKYFYTSSVISTFGAVNPSEPLAHEKELVSILHSFGESFLQPDISVFKHNLEALEKLNSKWKLYHKSIFLDSMMTQFLAVLLQALVIRSHDLLQEEIITAVYNMAAVDFSMFYKTFLPAFLQQVSTIDFYQKQTLRDNLSSEDQDLPTFTSSILRMVNDLRYYTIINASLPPGTIDLSQAEPEPISEY